MEKIRSGQSFLYRQSGYASTVIDVRMTDRVSGSALNRALSLSLERFPYFTSKLVEKEGNFYLEEDAISMTAVRTKKSRILGSMSTGYHLIDITYTDEKICVSFHHALCDGRGIKPFIETLIYYYCSFRYHKTLNPTGIRLAGESLLAGEKEEPYGKEFLSVDMTQVKPVSKEGFSLPEVAEEKTAHYRTEITIDQSQFVEFAKANGATPAILLSMIVSNSIHSVHPEADEPIICSMATDLRGASGNENTHKNCVGSLYLPYTSETATMPLAEQGTHFRQVMADQRTEDAMKLGLNMQIGLYNKLDTMETLDEKRAMMAFFDDMVVDTYVISYLGRFQLEACAEYIHSIHLYSSGTRGLIVNMTAVGNTITLDILQHFDSMDIVQGIVGTLKAFGINHEASDPIDFATKNDRAYVTASRQAERYFK